MARKQREPQRDLFGNVIEDRPKAGSQLSVLDFEDYPVRVVMIKGEPWWVVADVCRVVGVDNPRQAVTRLDDDQRTTVISNDGSGKPLNLVSESGLYSLVLTTRLRKDHPAFERVKRFRRWVTHEVLPTIRRTGSYSMGQDRVTRERKRLGCDHATATARVLNRDENIANHADLARLKACPNDFKAMHNATYRGQFGVEAGQLRAAVGIKGRRPPLDRMSPLALAANLHAKALARRLCRERGVPLENRPDVYEREAREIATADLAKFRPGAMYGVVEDDRRGKIIDVIAPQLAG